MKKIKLLLGLAIAFFAVLPNKSHAQMTTLKVSITDSTFTYCKLPYTQYFPVGASGVGTGVATDSVTFNVNFGDGLDTTFKAGLVFSSGLGWANSLIYHEYTIPGTFTTRIIAVAPSGIRDTSYGKGFTLSNTCGTLNGQLYIDRNSNCVFDATEEGMGYMPIVAINTTTLDTVHAGWANNDGKYSISLTPGNYNILPGYQRLGSGILNVNPFAAPSCPATGAYSLTVVGSGAYTKDFAYDCVATPSSFDAKVIVSAAGRFFPGDTTCVYLWGGSWAWYHYYSCIAAGISTTVTVNLDPKLTYLSSTGGFLPSISGSTLTYTLGSPADLTLFYTGIFVRTATTATIGDTVRINAYIAPYTGILDPVLADNTYNFKRAVSNSYDPNMKEVAPMGNGVEGFIKADEQMTYTVHFQNTGTAAARNVTIVDEIDTDLEKNSLRILGATHNVTQHLTGNKISFRFENINLADSSSDFLGSMGSITYAIKQKKGLAPGTEMTNTAAIYFDYNEPIITNTTLNTINLPTSIENLSLSGTLASIYPNPANTSLNVKLSEKQSFSATMHDILGRVVMTQGGNNGTMTIDIKTLSEGLYIISISDAKGNTQSSKVHIKH